MSPEIPFQITPAGDPIDPFPDVRPGLPVVVRCNCGGAFTRPQWDGLPWLGIQRDPLFLTELRHCPHCRTTLGYVTAVSEEGQARTLPELIDAQNRLLASCAEESAPVFREVRVLQEHIMGRLLREGRLER
jgi:hypothetical protein